MDAAFWVTYMCVTRVGGNGARVGQRVTSLLSLSQ